MEPQIKVLKQRSTTMEPHSHLFGQISYTLEGVLYIQAENKVYIVPPNMAIYLPPKIVHQNKTHKKVIITTLYISNKFKKIFFNQVRLINITELIKNIITKINLMTKAELHQSKGRRLISILLDEIFMSEPVSYTELVVTDNLLIKKVYDIFYKAKNEYPSVEQTAQLIHVSSRTLLRVFKKETGMSFIIWKQRFLFLKAIELLQKYRSTSLVAYHLGYKSDSAFISMFKKMSGGRLPSHFKKVNYER